MKYAFSDIPFEIVVQHFSQDSYLAAPGST